MLIDNLTQYIAAAAGLGTAAFALVDATKSIRGGVSNFGFDKISKVVAGFYDAKEETLREKARLLENPAAAGDPLGLAAVLGTLKSNWFNGVPLTDQRAIAKTLIKLRLTKETAALLAKSTGVDAAKLGAVASKLAAGETLSQEENDVYGRFDLMITILLDQGYQMADQEYRNGSRMAAIVVAVALALVGCLAVFGPLPGKRQLLGAILLGMAATPIAPIAKDLTNALAAGVRVAQTMRK